MRCPDFKWIYNSCMIIRWLLALIFAITSVATPVGATCAIDSSMTQQCCCHQDDQDNTACTMRDTCCTDDDQETAATVNNGQQVGWHPSESNFTVNMRATYEAPENTINSRKHFRALHLASNKLYLKKCALLI